MVSMATKLLSSGDCERVATPEVRLEGAKPGSFGGMNLTWLLAARNVFSETTRAR